MRTAIFLWVVLMTLWIIGSCENDVKPPYYIVSVGDYVYYTNKVIDIDNGIKFYSFNAQDTIEVHGSYTKRYYKPQVKEINHNDYSK